MKDATMNYHWTTASIPPEKYSNMISSSSFFIAVTLVHVYQLFETQFESMTAFERSFGQPVQTHKRHATATKTTTTNITSNITIYLLYFWFVSWLFKKHCSNNRVFKQLLKQSWEILMIVINYFSLSILLWLIKYIRTYLNLLRYIRIYIKNQLFSCMLKFQVQPVWHV